MIKNKFMLKNISFEDDDECLECPFFSGEWEKCLVNNHKLFSCEETGKWFRPKDCPLEVEE